MRVFKRLTEGRPIERVRWANEELEEGALWALEREVGTCRTMWEAEILSLVLSGGVWAGEQRNEVGEDGARGRGKVEWQGDGEREREIGAAGRVDEAGRGNVEWEGGRRGEAVNIAEHARGAGTAGWADSQRSAEGPEENGEGRGHRGGREGALPGMVRDFGEGAGLF